MRRLLLLVGSLTLLVGSCFASATTQRNFMIISDIHLDSHKQSAMPIAPKKARFTHDLDNTTFQRIIARTADEINQGSIAKPDFILMLGDIVGHHRATNQDVYNSESVVFSTLQQQFPNTPKFYVFGNNDSFERNYGKFTASDGSSPLSVAKQSGWRHGFLSTGKNCKGSSTQPCLITTNTQRGYYAAYLAPKLRLLALNSVAFSVTNKTTSDKARREQLTWLAQQLQTAQQQHETVLIAMHIPVGDDAYNHSSFWRAPYQQEFIDLIAQHHAQIQAVLVGHTHFDELRLLRNAQGDVIGSQIFTAALSTSHGNSVGLKTFALTQDAKQQWHLANYYAYGFAGDLSHLNFISLYNYANYYVGKSVIAEINTALDFFDNGKMRRYYKARDAWR